MNEPDWSQQINGMDHATDWVDDHDLYEQVWQAVLNYICNEFGRYYSDRSETAEDLASIVLNHVIVKWGKWKEHHGSTGGSFFPWLLTTAKNRVISEIRRMKTNSYNLDEYTDALEKRDRQDPNRFPPGMKKIMQRITDVSMEPARIAERNLVWEQFDDAMVRLPPKQAQAFILVKIEDYKYKEAATVLGRNVNTVKSDVRKAKKNLVKLWESDDERK